MSLSGWFRDYLYIPLGGNRRGTLRTMCNKLLVFLATGLWHGLWSCVETALPRCAAHWRFCCSCFA